MKSLRIFKRLDLQLSLIVAAIVGLWFASSLISAHLLNQEKATRNAALEREKIISRIKSEEPRILNDILLDHEKALELTVGDLYKSLNLKWIELSCHNNHKITHGTKESASDRMALKESFPIRFEGKEYGTLTVTKELWVVSDTSVFADKWVYGVGLVMALIFIIIRVFIRRQIITPINSLINTCAVEKNWLAPCNLKGNSVEIEGLIHSFNEMKTTIVDYQQKAVKAERQAALVSLASQVAHDIRSPLTALSLVNEELSGLPEDKRIMVRSAIARIHDIANNLLVRNRPEYLPDCDTDALPDSVSSLSADPVSNQLISSVIDNLISEKRMHFRSKLGIEIVAKIDADSYGVFARIQPNEFKRVLSNLINNAVEALPESGRVEVCLCAESDLVTVLVRDNGKGIPAEMLPKIMDKGVTFEKEGGSGLGLYHAKSTIESWGGSIEVDSQPKVGTTVKLTLAKEEPPEWFVPELCIYPGSTVVILDDDLSIHQIWQKRMDSLEATVKGVKIFHFSTLPEITQWHETARRKKEKILYLFDYELIGQQKNGLEVIEALGIAERSILVTSRYEEKRVVETCLRLRVRLIPKALAAFVPISIADPLLLAQHESIDCVLIDDDPIVHMTWRTAARKKGKRLKIFRSPDRFWSFAQNMKRSTPIYIDSNLGKEIKGEFVAKGIHEMGFRNIRLTTGFKPEQFKEMNWLREVVGKEPPWTT